MSHRKYLLVKVLALTALMPLMTLAQSHERTIDKLSWRTEPIKIVQVKTKGKTVAIGKKFEEEDDWLTGLTVTVQNISDKAIARIELALTFTRPEGTSETVPRLRESMIFGEDPSTTSAYLKLLQPGETTDIKLLEVNLPSIQKALRDLGYPDRITRVRMMVSFVTFADGSTWAGDGIILYPDPKNPKQKFNPKTQPK
jgi:hypothetical protein